MAKRGSNVPWPGYVTVNCAIGGEPGEYEHDTEAYPATGYPSGYSQWCLTLPKEGIELAVCDIHDSIPGVTIRIDFGVSKR